MEEGWSLEDPEGVLLLWPLPGGLVKSLMSMETEEPWRVLPGGDLYPSQPWLADMEGAMPGG